MSDDHATLAIFLNVTDLPVLIVGGGAVGCRRANALVTAGARDVLLVSKDPPVESTPGVAVVVEAFRPEHLSGRRLAFAATDAAAVNESVQYHAAAAGVLCCRADAAESGDFVTPLTVTRGPLTLAVAAGSPALTRRARDDLEAVAQRWADLAAATAALRPTLLASPDKTAARAALADLATDAARDVLQSQGVDGLRRWLVRRHPPSLGLSE